MRNFAAKVRHRRLGEQRSRGTARLRRDDETDKPRSGGSCSEACDHGGVREAVRTADDRHGADGTLVRVTRPRTKAPYYLLRRFHVRVIIPKNAARHIRRAKSGRGFYFRSRVPHSTAAPVETRRRTAETRSGGRPASDETAAR